MPRSRTNPTPRRLRPNGDLPEVLRDPEQFAGIRHARCVEHVQVEGYQEAVCILAGQDRREVLAFANDLLGHNRTPGEPMDAEQSHPTPGTPRRPTTEVTPRGRPATSATSGVAPGAGSRRYRERRHKYGPGREGA